MGDFHVERLGHVHVVVRVRAQDFVSWAVDQMGPLFLRSRDGHNCLALFTSPSGHRDGSTARSPSSAACGLFRSSAADPIP